MTKDMHEYHVLYTTKDGQPHTHKVLTSTAQDAADITRALYDGILVEHIFRIMENWR